MDKIDAEKNIVKEPWLGFTPPFFSGISPRCAELLAFTQTFKPPPQFSQKALLATGAARKTSTRRRPRTSRRRPGMPPKPLRKVLPRQRLRRRLTRVELPKRRHHPRSVRLRSRRSRCCRCDAFLYHGLAYVVYPIIHACTC